MIAILGDTHLPRGSRRLPDRCLALLGSSSSIVHTGDLTALGVLEQLERLAPVHAVHGNADEAAVCERLLARLVVQLEGRRVGLVHDGGPRTGRHARLRRWFPDCDIIVYGHSHLPELEWVEGAWILNPGSPTERRRAPARSMAVVEDGKPRLVEL